MNNSSNSSSAHSSMPSYKKLNLRNDRYILTAMNGAIRQSFATLEDRSAAYEMISKRKFKTAADFVDAIKTKGVAVDD